MRRWAERVRSAGTSDINLLSYRKRIVDLDPEIPNGALDFCMAEQDLNGPQLAEAAAAVGCRLDFSERFSPSALCGAVMSD
jgi:hypothetical protein